MQTVANIHTEAKIDTATIPAHEAAHLARATLKAVESFFALPGVKEDYEKWLIDYKKRKAAAV